MQSLVDDDLTDDLAIVSEVASGTVPAWMKTLLESVDRWSALLPKVELLSCQTYIDMSSSHLYLLRAPMDRWLASSSVSLPLQPNCWSASGTT